MDNISNYMKRRFVLQKILRMIRVAAMFLIFAFLLSDNEVEKDFYQVGNEQLIYSSKNIEIGDIERTLSKKARNVSYVGSMIAFVVILATIPIELIFVRCPKCNSYIWGWYTPNFCAKCGLKFNSKDEII